MSVYQNLHVNPNDTLIVDAHNGPETWTGQEWNEFVDQADRNGAIITVRILELHKSEPDSKDED